MGNFYSKSRGKEPEESSIDGAGDSTSAGDSIKDEKLQSDDLRNGINDSRDGEHVCSRLDDTNGIDGTNTTEIIETEIVIKPELDVHDNNVSNQQNISDDEPELVVDEDTTIVTTAQPSHLISVVDDEEEIVFDVETNNAELCSDNEDVATGQNDELILCEDTERVIKQVPDTSSKENVDGEIVFVEDADSKSNSNEDVQCTFETEDDNNDVVKQQHEHRVDEHSTNATTSESGNISKITLDHSGNILDESEQTNTTVKPLTLRVDDQGSLSVVDAKAKDTYTDKVSTEYISLFEETDSDSELRKPHAFIDPTMDCTVKLDSVTVNQSGEVTGYNYNLPAMDNSNTECYTTLDGPFVYETGTSLSAQPTTVDTNSRKRKGDVSSSGYYDTSLAYGESEGRDGSKKKKKKHKHKHKHKNRDSY